MLEVEFCQIKEKVGNIRKQLESGKVKKEDLPPYKTRLVHLIFRLIRLKRVKFNTCGLDQNAVRLYNEYFTVWSNNPEKAREAARRLELEISKIGAIDELITESDDTEDSGEGIEAVSAEGESSENEDDDLPAKKKKTSTPKKILKNKQTGPIDTQKIVEIVVDQVSKHFQEQFRNLMLDDRFMGGIVSGKKSGKTKDRKGKSQQKANGKSRVEKPRKGERRSKKKQQSTTESEETVSSEGDDSLDSSDDSEPEPRRERKLRRPRPVSEWNLRYDGKDDGKRLNKFIAEVEGMAEAENLSKRALFKEAIHLFSGEVRTWYMEGKKNRDFTNWKELLVELKVEFQPPDLDYHYEQQATLRRQRRSEKFSEYYNAMKEIFSFMARQPSEDRKFDIVYRNLRADYRSALLVKEIKTLRLLKVWGRKLDAANWFLYRGKETGSAQKSSQVNEVYQSSSQKFDKPQPKPDWKPKGTGNKPGWSDNRKQSDQPRKPTENKNEKSSQPGPTKTQQQPGNSRATLEERVVRHRVPDSTVCYNCRGKYHHFKACLKERELFCAVCGFYDFTHENCPFCAKNGRKSA
ncbi:conserved hypothetical protein [Culex quinquefasciatus]|uniref:Uncharacterized protein n=1 Tax=Culex quinquefasciatus TaxID=7176 RepID=B0XH44_CULQU|nr:conserved hypothetical protein [Culex quinquefasciatus]|eukprot:XP_001868966.1 conserved hypothetical protein [Culex quinquefasciatus]